VESKKYLIGPGLFGTYLKILKTVVPVVVVLAAVGTAIDASINSYGFFKAVLLVLNSIFNAAVWSFGIVTFIFAVGERQGWNPMEENGEDQKKSGVQKPFSRAGTIVGMIFIAVLLGVFNGFSEILGYYSTPGATLHPLFNQDVFMGYLLYINLVLAAQLIFQASKLVYRKWNYTMALANLAINAASLVLFLLMVGDPNLINSGFITEIAKQSGEAAEGVRTGLSMLRSVLYVVIPAIIIFDTGEGFWNAFRNSGRS